MSATKNSSTSKAPTRSITSRKYVRLVCRLVVELLYPPNYFYEQRGIYFKCTMTSVLKHDIFFCSYLSKFDKLGEFPRERKGAEYKRYLGMLLDYFYSFISRVRPLYDLHEAMDVISREFNTKWAVGDVSGITAGNSGLFTLLVMLMESCCTTNILSLRLAKGVDGRWTDPIPNPVYSRRAPRPVRIFHLGGARLVGPGQAKVGLDGVGAQMRRHTRRKGQATVQHKRWVVVTSQVIYWVQRAQSLLFSVHSR